MSDPTGIFTEEPKVPRDELPLSWPLWGGLGLILCFVSPASAQFLDYELSSRFQTYELQSSQTRLERWSELTESVRLDVYRILGRPNVSFHTQFEFARDFSISTFAYENYGLILRPLGAEGEGNDSAFHIRGGGTDWEAGRYRLNLLFATLEARRLFDRIDLSVGRVFDLSLLGFHTFDGARVRARLPFTLFAEGFLGSPARPLEEDIDTTYEDLDRLRDPLDTTVDGTNRQGDLEEIGRRRGFSWGGTIGLAPTFGGIDLLTRIAFRRGQIGGEVDEARLGGDIDLRLHEIVRLYGSVIQDLYLAQTDEIESGVQLRFLEGRLESRSTYRRQRPDFRADSIFNVFSTLPYHQARERITAELPAFPLLGRRIVPRAYLLYAWTRFLETREREDPTFGEDGTYIAGEYLAEVADPARTAHALEVGSRFQLPWGNRIDLSLRYERGLSFFQVAGFEGETLGGGIRGLIHLQDRKCTLSPYTNLYFYSGGFDNRRTLSTPLSEEGQGDGLSLAFGIMGRYRFEGWGEISARIEDYVNEIYRSQLRLFVAVNLFNYLDL